MQFLHCQNMSLDMRKPTTCIYENKGADHHQLRGNAKLISVFVIATRIVPFLYFLNPKFPASSHLLCLYNSVCVRPVRKSHCWFSDSAAYYVAKSPVCICISYDRKFYTCKQVFSTDYVKQYLLGNNFVRYLAVFFLIQF